MVGALDRRHVEEQQRQPRDDQQEEERRGDRARARTSSSSRATPCMTLAGNQCSRKFDDDRVAGLAVGLRAGSSRAASGARRARSARLGLGRGSAGHAHPVSHGQAEVAVDLLAPGRPPAGRRRARSPGGTRPAARGAGPATLVPSPVYCEPWHGQGNRCVSRSGAPPTVHRLGLRQRLRADRAAEVRADRGDGVEGVALAEDEQPLVGQELEPVGELRRAARASPSSARRRRRSGTQRAQRGGAPGSPMAATPAPVPSFSRKSRRSVVRLMPSSGRQRVPLGGAQRSLIVKRSIVMASVGQRMAHRPQRMQRSSSLTIAESGRPFGLGARGERRRCVGLGQVERVERHDREAVLGADVHAAVAEHALLGVVDRLDVADEAARGLAPRPRAS